MGMNPRPSGSSSSAGASKACFPGFPLRRFCLGLSSGLRFPPVSRPALVVPTRGACAGVWAHCLQTGHAHLIRNCSLRGTQPGQMAASCLAPAQVWSAKRTSRTSNQSPQPPNFTPTLYVYSSQPPQHITRHTFHDIFPPILMGCESESCVRAWRQVA